MSDRPDRFGVVHTAPVLMTTAERVVLYGLVYGLRPRRCLEIGTHKGGSAAIIVAALDDLGDGSLACVDPNPLLAPETWVSIRHRATMHAGGSPAILPEARKALGGPVDFALIDGDHETPGVILDIEGTLPLLSRSAYLLFHDAHNRPVEEGIDRMLAKHRRLLTDCGMVSAQRTPDPEHPGVTWGGLRMLRFSNEKKPAPKGLGRILRAVRSS